MVSCLFTRPRIQHIMPLSFHLHHHFQHHQLGAKKAIVLSGKCLKCKHGYRLKIHLPLKGGHDKESLTKMTIFSPLSRHSNSESQLRRGFVAYLHAINPVSKPTNNLFCVRLFDWENLASEKMSTPIGYTPKTGSKKTRHFSYLTRH